VSLRGFSTASLARASARHRWVVVAVWAVLFVVSGIVVATLLGGALTTTQVATNDPESARANALIDERFPTANGISELVIVRSASLTVDDSRYREFVEQLQARLAALGPDVVSSAGSYYLTGDESLVSTNRQTTLLPLLLTGSLDEARTHIEDLHAIVDSAGESAEFDVFQIGFVTSSRDFQEISEKDLQTGELFALPIAMVILVLVFGALVAALLPLLLAALTIVVALGFTALIGQAIDLSFFVVNMITMMGLAVGIDYSLFIVSRFREERRNGRDQLDAITVTGATASRAVLFSGMTVVVALVGLLIVPLNVFQSLAAGAIMVVVVAVVAALTLLPAILSLLGDRVNALRVPIIGRVSAEAQRGREGAIWDRITRTVMRRPVISLTLAAGILIAAAVPYFGIKTGAAGVSSLPEGIRSRDAQIVLQEEFSVGLISPVQIVVDGDVASPDVQGAIERLQASLVADPDFGPPNLAPNPAARAALLRVPLAHDPVSPEAIDAVRRLRDDLIPRAFEGVDARAFVTGVTASNLEFFDVTDQYTPIVFAFVLGISFLLLTVVFRSLVVPLKAIVMNLLSVGAAYGLIVLVSQHGVGAELLGFQQVDTVEAWIPIFLFAVLFGLSMDYHVFMLSRIRERFDQRGDNTEAVAFGLRTTGGLITGAAAIMVAVFGGFAAGELVMFQQVGFGLAVAVFLDATIVRSVLVPSTMKLLGTRNWYLPGFLQWLPDLRVEPSAPAIATQADPVPVEAESRR
jgi:RND superfamily putative drug exporter